jgi:hypothetical protein
MSENMEKFEVRGITFTAWHHHIGPPTNWSATVAGQQISIGASKQSGYWYSHPFIEKGVHFDKPHTPQDMAEMAFDDCHLRVSNMCQAFAEAIATRDGGVDDAARNDY